MEKVRLFFLNVNLHGNFDKNLCCGICIMTSLESTNWNVTRSNAAFKYLSAID
jgi:hypothetical protein